MNLRIAPPAAVAFARLALVACTFAASPLAAQGVPAWAIGVDAGSGPRTERAGETYYRNNRDPILRFTGELRLATFGLVSPVLQVQGVPNGLGDQLADCPFAPNGTCRKYPPEHGGWGVGAGLAVAPLRFVTASLAAGRGRFGGTGRNFVEAKLALSPVRHVAVTASLTHLTWKEANGYPHWFRPVLLGLRIQ